MPCVDAALPSSPGRKYSDEEVALLRFVKAQMEQGATIGGLAEEGRDSLVARMRVAMPVSADEERPHRRIGERWHQGHLTIAVEHYVTKLIQQKMFSV